MASLEELESILHEIEPEVQELDEKFGKKTYTSSEPLILLSTELVLGTVNELTESSIINSPTKMSLRNAPVEELTESLEWLSGCLVKKRTMVSAAINQVWQAYHKALQQELLEMSKVTSSTQASAILALHIMKALVQKNYRKPTETLTHNSVLTERDIEIITYITGFLLRRYQQLPEAKALCGNEATGFTAAIDRGGLMKPKPDFVQVVVEMEEVFRGLATKCVDRDHYLQLLCERDVPNKLFELIQEVETQPEEKEHFYSKITNLFFTVRAHQKCRHFLEQHIKKTHTMRKSKALRDSL